MTPREPSARALITGATGGIGAAFARALPEETAMILTGRDEEALTLLAAEFGPRAETVVADLATHEGLDAVARAAEAGEVDLLINNAGLGQYGNFLDVPFEEHQTTLRVNVEAVMALIHRLVPGMIDRAELSGRNAGLINVASSAAFFPIPTLATYAASKALVLSFTESFAAEMSGKPIDVLVSCPGAVKTAFGARAGYSGGRIPGAMAPEKVAAQSLAALGRQSTVVIGPASAAAFAPVALARSLFGHAFVRASRVMDRIGERT
ncbi:SDR family NAD(P)-dependent oxidoreductase [Acuticoccus sp. MNP-M23]|uniref:SDR family NAD(P)-dependent oxidoreductase n=1 Tax=Acuticoccus sp. MNP-M23 TaxID=3072793 RepID=UPI002816739D|nr:SDR family NAD(P)-dependent oxidoreductase [Acuticoccus sp. MNP-M23]WMS42964.1 SDR family NAD(P)-dependent oxidoreductase [Acuticoccus sp. MNP-M23]